MAGCGVADVVVGGFGDCGAEGLRIGGVPEAPYIFYFLFGECEGFFDVDVRG